MAGKVFYFSDYFLPSRGWGLFFDGKLKKIKGDKIMLTKVLSIIVVAIVVCGCGASSKYDFGLKGAPADMLVIVKVESVRLTEYSSQLQVSLVKRPEELRIVYILIQASSLPFHVCGKVVSLSGNTAVLSLNDPDEIYLFFPGQELRLSYVPRKVSK